MTLEGHAKCVRFMKNFKAITCNSIPVAPHSAGDSCVLQVPTLVVGGGGYNIRNVARCWAYETSVLLDQEISDDIPMNDFIQVQSSS